MKFGSIVACVALVLLCLTGCSSAASEGPDGDSAAKKVAERVESANRGTVWYSHVTNWNAYAIAADIKVLTDYSVEEVDSYRWAVAICESYALAVDPAARPDVYLEVDGVLHKSETNVDGSKDDLSRPKQLARLASQSGDKHCVATPSYLDDPGLKGTDIPFV